MNIGLLSVRYAKALLAFAQSKNMENELYAQAKFIQEVFVSIRSLHAALDNPLIPKDKKREIVTTASGEGITDVFVKFIDLLLKNNREDCLQSIMLQYQEQYRKSKNILHGKLITAIEINKVTETNLIAAIEEKVEGELELEKKVDPKILGGFILDLDSVRWDAGISNQLNRIKNQYIERNRRII